MKKVFFILIALFMVTTTFAETSNDGKRPKRPNSSGFNYAKHYRKARHHDRMNRWFDRDHCNHYRKYGY